MLNSSSLSTWSGSRGLQSILIIQRSLQTLRSATYDKLAWFIVICLQIYLMLNFSVITFEYLLEGSHGSWQRAQKMQAHTRTVQAMLERKEQSPPPRPEPPPPLPPPARTHGGAAAPPSPAPLPGLGREGRASAGSGLFSRLTLSKETHGFILGPSISRQA